MQAFCSSGQSERVKGAVHGAAGTLVGVMALYNAVAWWYRRERHLGVNAVLYTAGLAFEVYQTTRHFRRCPVTRHEVPTVTRAHAIAAQEVPAADSCVCGDGFCWCGSAESQAYGFSDAAQLAGVGANSDR